MKKNTHDQFRIETDGEVYSLSLTDTIKEDLGDISFVRLPKIGLYIKQGAPFAELEGEKAVTEFTMPLSGRIIAVNEKAIEHPELLNAEEQAWLIRFDEVSEKELENFI